MTRNQPDDDEANSYLSQFEKNRFFEGKLMTPRDMETEQEFHTDRVHTLARATAGTGIVHGLTITDVSQDGDELAVTIEPGLAIDGRGRPIVVEHTTTKSLPAPGDDEIALALRYSEAAVESVPVPEAGSGNEYTPNRTVEVFELTAQETVPDQSLPNIDIPITGDDPDPAAVSRALAARYQQQDHPTDDPSVFVGAFERTPEGSWVATESHRPVVYRPDLLYATLLEHITDTDNPHHTSTDEEPTAIDEVEELDTIQQRLAQLQSELAAVKERNDRLDRYAMRKALQDGARCFEGVADRFESHCGATSKTAREIATIATDGVRAGVYESADQYRDCLQTILEAAVDLGDSLEGTTKDAERDRFIDAVAALQSELDADGPTHELALALDHLGETAATLEVAYDVRPNP